MSSKAQWLLERIREIGFGRIEGLLIRDSEPVFDPPPRVIREIKLGASDTSVSQFDHRKPQISELLALFEQIDDGVIDCIEVRHGLPFRVVITDQHRGKEV